MTPALALLLLLLGPATALKFGPYAGDHGVVVSYESFVETGMTVFELSFPTVGWVAFGASETGSMIGSNPLVVMEDPPGSAVFRCIAMHSNKDANNHFSTPLRNAVQNCNLLSIDRTDGTTTVVIERPMVGCTESGEDINFIAEWDQRFIFAFGQTQDFVYHSTNRSAFAFNAVYGMAEEYCELTNDTVAFDARISEQPWSLPDYRDIYYCKAVDLPQDQRYHMVQYEPILFQETISPASYHHIIVWQCPSGIESKDEWLTMAPCNAGILPECLYFFVAWAIGQKSVCLSDHGYAVGAGDGALKWAFLEIHIDNPTLDTTIEDGGMGLRMWITPTLRPIEAAMFGLDTAFPWGGIPGRRDSYVLATALGGECTAVVPEEGLTLLSIMPHMHGKGSSYRVMLLRGSDPTRQAVTLLEQKFWDFNLQGPRFLPYQEQPIVLHRGDQLILHCEYNTSQYEEPTYWGEGFEEEMCMAFISYLEATTDYPLAYALGRTALEFNPANSSYTRYTGLCLCLDVIEDDRAMYNFTGIVQPPPDASQCGVALAA